MNCFHADIFVSEIELSDLASLVFLFLCEIAAFSKQPLQHPSFNVLVKIGKSVWVEDEGWDLEDALVLVEADHHRGSVHLASSHGSFWPHRQERL